MKKDRKLRNVAVSLVLGSTVVQLNAMGLQNRWVPDILKPGAEEYLPDYSYAGYHNGERPLPRVKPTLMVTDFGAKADDGLDDTDAIKKAIAHAAKEIELEYDPSAYIEGTNRKDLAVPSLYEYQLRKRLNK